MARLALILALAGCVNVNVRGSGSGSSGGESDTPEVEDPEVADLEVVEDVVEDVPEVEEPKDILFDPEAGIPPDPGPPDPGPPDPGPPDPGETCEGCTIDGQCYPDSTEEPGNPCRLCLAAQSTTAWTNVAGICDDVDDCTTNDKCLAGACAGEAIPGCGLVDECTYHAECNPAGVCAKWLVTSTRKCSAPCAGPGDCPGGQTCSKLPGSANIGFCEDAVPGGKQAGASCQAHVECATGLCAGLCVYPCLDAAHCPAGSTCTVGDDTANGILTSFCAPDQAGLLLNGQDCSQDGESYGGAVCQSSHCNLLGPAPWKCAGPCTGEADCPADQECNIVLYSPSPNPGTLPFSESFSSTTYHDVFMGCYAQPTPGFKGDGQICGADAECQSGKCQQLDAASPTMFCTSFCTDDSECPATLKCRMDALGLTSNWLTSDELLTQGPQPTSLTFVRVCRTP